VASLISTVEVKLGGGAHAGPSVPPGRTVLHQSPERENMTEGISIDGRTLVGVANDDAGEVSGETTFTVEQTGDRISARYSGGPIVEGHLLGTVDDGEWDVRYVQLNENGETATGHSVGEISVLEDGRVRIEDQWEWESKDGEGESVLEEVEE